MSVEVACKICNKAYKIRPSYLKGGRNLTCSKLCGYKIVSSKLLGKNNGAWKGTDVGYTALHNWIRRRKPMPIVCEKCKENKPYDLANISQKYNRTPEDFEWLCRKCHMQTDNRIFNLKQWKTKEN